MVTIKIVAEKQYLAVGNLSSLSIDDQYTKLQLRRLMSVLIADGWKTEGW